ncbi:MAG: SH3 domain-containing protein [Gammaproteobacteria bacterium]|nr:SH3 domain-containing protein [Gammaproteobacteria bacterium]
MKSYLYLLLPILLLSSWQSVAEEPSVSIEVIDPFVELHTGPGEGYPVFYTVEQGERVTILKRRPDWYEITSEYGQTGWAKAAQIARTLLPTGEPVDLPSVSYGDYLEGSFFAGFNTGRFSKGELDSAEVITFNAGYRWNSWLSLEFERSKFYDAEVRGRYYGGVVRFEPYSEWKFSPSITVGSGSLKISSQPELIPLDIDESSYLSLGVGLSIYVGRNFLVKAEFRDFKIDTDLDSERSDQWQLGFNAFF